VEPPTETLPIGLEARQHVSALYRTHALALVKLAVLMTGDQPTAEDVVQDAFLGLYRRWSALHDADKAIGYLRSSVLNGCRSVHRVRFRRQGITVDPPGHADSAEAEPCSARRTARCLPRSAACRPASARPSCSATTWT
jgi:DNA-directed RNA polymerase specialized sigma24 family protein